MGGGTSQPLPPPLSPLESLTNMGFASQAGQIALDMHDGDLERALHFLVEQKQIEERTKRADAATQRHGANKQPAPKAKAAQPVKAPAASSSPLDRLEDQPAVIDTLFYVLNTIAEHPSELKYRSLKTTNKRFQEIFSQDSTVASLVERYLGHECGFEKAGEYFALPPNCDFARNVLAQRDRLQAIQLSSPVYLASKRRTEYELVMAESQRTADAEEQARRLEYRRLLPAEPTKGEAGTTRIQVYCSQGGLPIQRTFTSHDTLRDIVHFVGSERSSLIAQMLLKSNNKWHLVDETLLDKRAFDAGAGDLDKTLFALNLWPSAVLHVRLVH